MKIVVVVQLLSHVQLYVTPWTSVCQAFLSFTISQSLLKFMSIDSVILSNHHILCIPLFPFPSVFPSIRVFSSVSSHCIRWPKCSSFSFNIRFSNEFSGLIPFSIGSPCSPRDSQSLVQHNLKQHFFDTQHSLWSNSHIHI